MSCDELGKYILRRKRFGMTHWKKSTKDVVLYILDTSSTDEISRFDIKLDSYYDEYFSAIDSKNVILPNNQSININTGEIKTVRHAIPYFNNLQTEYKDKIFKLDNMLRRLNSKGKEEIKVNVYGMKTTGGHGIIGLKDTIVIIFYSGFDIVLAFFDSETLKEKMRFKIKVHRLSILELQTLNDHEFIFVFGNKIIIIDMEDMNSKRAELENDIYKINFLPGGNIIIIDEKKNLILLNKKRMEKEVLIPEDVLTIYSIDDNFIFVKDSSTDTHIFSVKERRFICKTQFPPDISDQTASSPILNVPLTEGEESTEITRLQEIIHNILPISNDLERLVAKYI